jgi:DNA-binding NarL/FixJ family response regulator
MAEMDSHGLLHIRQRLHLFGGGIAIRSEASLGTTVPGFARELMNDSQENRPVAFIVENHKLVAEVTARALREKGNIDVAGMVNSAEEAVEQLPHMQVDVVLVDISLPAMTGLELVSILQKKYPKLPCLILSGHKQAIYVRRALDAGARGYVVKGDLASLISGVKQVLQGQIYLSHDLLPDLSPH